MIEKLILSKGAYLNVLRSVIEGWPREQAGHLYGFEGNTTLVVTNAHPDIIVKTRKMRMVDSGRYRDTRRVAFEKAIEGSLDSIVGPCGTFHSHISRNPKRDNGFDLNVLSGTDILGVEAEMQEHRKNLTEYIELLSKVRRTKYSEPKEIGISETQYPKKLRAIIRVPETLTDSEAKYRWDITLMAFRLIKRPNHSELKAKSPGGANVRKRFIITEIPVKRED